VAVPTIAPTSTDQPEAVDETKPMECEPTGNGAPEINTSEIITPESRLPESEERLVEPSESKAAECVSTEIELAENVPAESKPTDNIPAQSKTESQTGKLSVFFRFCDLLFESDRLR